MVDENEKFKKQENKNLKEGEGTLLLVHVKDYEFWKEKIYVELIAKTKVKELTF